jgi:hypothetical protein
VKRLLGSTFIKQRSRSEFLAGLRGTLSVTFEEDTWAAWLYDLLKPRVANLADR